MCGLRAVFSGSYADRTSDVLDIRRVKNSLIVLTLLSRCVLSIPRRLARELKSSSPQSSYRSDSASADPRIDDRNYP